ncbi:BLUF domain-containing protein [Arenimonas sp.]|uniref:BLUF domain-containing protein n=1 Tax=Arenimonas sp. TaxID=1872635 RepID=UPI0035B3EDAA
MPRYLRLTYVSRATFPPVRDGAAFHPEVGRILVQSRRNNARQRLVGGLYFADGCFFQVLEGPAEDVEALYAKLQQDPRHEDLQVLERREIPEPEFRGWTMKHVPDAPEVRSLMARHGRIGFEPYSFSPELVQSMVALLLGTPDSGQPAAPIRGEAERDAASRRTEVSMLLGAAGLLVSAAALAIVLFR